MVELRNGRITGNMAVALVLNTLSMLAGQLSAFRQDKLFDFYAGLPISRSGVILASVAVSALFAMPGMVLTLVLGMLIFHITEAIPSSGVPAHFRSAHPSVPGPPTTWLLQVCSRRQRRVVAQLCEHTCRAVLTGEGTTKIQRQDRELGDGLQLRARGFTRCFIGARRGPDA